MSSASQPATAGTYVKRAASSSLGMKLVMAASGLLFYGWLILHLVGNLSIFAGRLTMNEYAHLLHSKPALLWGQRIALLAIVATHIYTGIRLAQINRAARPQPYQSPRKWRQATLASRSMLVSGLVVLGFLAFHLAHFTGNVILPEFAPKTNVDGILDVYSMVVQSFRIPWVAALYIVGVGTIGLHLSHAVWSSTQTLGLNGPKWTPMAKTLGFLLGVGVAALFCLIPLAGVLQILK